MLLNRTIRKGYVAKLIEVVTIDEFGLISEHFRKPDARSRSVADKCTHAICSVQNFDFYSKLIEMHNKLASTWMARIAYSYIMI